jgi:hypothetical protein
MSAVGTNFPFMYLSHYTEYYLPLRRSIHLAEVVEKTGLWDQNMQLPFYGLWYCNQWV